MAGQPASSQFSQSLQKSYTHLDAELDAVGRVVVEHRDAAGEIEGYSSGYADDIADSSRRTASASSARLTGRSSQLCCCGALPCPPRGAGHRSAGRPRNRSS